MTNKKKIYCFDFDGTLTTKDTLIEFIKYAKGSYQLLLGFLQYSPLLILMKLHLFPNWKAKQLIFKHFFKGMKIADFDKLCKDFAVDKQQLLRPMGMTFLKDCQKQNAKVIIVSASIDNWVRPFFEQQGLTDIEVLGTQIEVTDEKVTGKFKTANCYGAEKVHRICHALGCTTTNQDGTCTYTLDRTAYEIEAFGDSRGDKEMLAFADIPHYKPFRE